jgi:hypothetical protein
MQLTLHSGGANGADKAWSDIGQAFGVIAKHYYAGQISHSNAPYGNTLITDQDMEEGKIKAALAAKANWGYNHSKMKDTRLIRNWSQVKYADAIFAIGMIITRGMSIATNGKDDRIALKTQVAGGTGYAVEMAIQENKPVYVFDQNRNNWYMVTETGYKRLDYIPTLTKNFAGIGTRKINEFGVTAIRSVYEETARCWQ